MPEIYFDETYKKRGTASRENVASRRRRRASAEDASNKNKNSWMALVTQEPIHVIKDEIRNTPSRKIAKRKNIASAFLGGHDFSFDTDAKQTSPSRRRHQSAKKRTRKDNEREFSKEDTDDASPGNRTGGKQHPRVSLSPTAQQTQQELRNDQGRRDNHGKDEQNSIAKASSLDSTFPSVDFILESIGRIHEQLTKLEEQPNEQKACERKKELLSAKESFYVLLDRHDSEDQAFL